MLYTDLHRSMQVTDSDGPHAEQYCCIRTKDWLYCTAAGVAREGMCEQQQQQLPHEHVTCHTSVAYQ
jgi:hypothetical protein